ncbi:MAG TPA: bacteriocin [Saprospiraceae bacterium]|nr:bacteriocin [Saprospiraceae bacterium]HMP24174.1 bacteriocin [Saprospiraceae bacterium]
MKNLNQNQLSQIIGGNFMDGYCGGAGLATIGRAILLGSIKAAFGGPVGTFLAVSDIACAGYGVYGMIKNWN